MIRLRGLGSNGDRAATAMEAVTDQCLPFEVSATWPGTFREDERGLPFVVFQVPLIPAGLVRFRRRVVITRRRILEAGHRTRRVNSDRVPDAVLAEAFGS